MLWNRIVNETVVVVVVDVVCCLAFGAVFGGILGKHTYTVFCPLLFGLTERRAYVSAFGFQCTLGADRISIPKDFFRLRFTLLADMTCHIGVRFISSFLFEMC